MANSVIFPLVLDITTFKSLYPEYNTTLLSDAILKDLWLNVPNLSPSFIYYYTLTSALSYWFKILAHLCQLRLTRQAGRVVSANQGKTTTTFENTPPEMAGSLQWWKQTVWGSEIAQLIVRYSGFAYVS